MIAVFTLGLLLAGAPEAPEFHAHLRKGVELLQQERVEAALVELRAAHRLNPRHADAAKLLAAQYVALRRPVEALNALSHIPPDEERSLLQIQAYLIRGDLPDVEEAGRIAARASKQFPDSPRLLTFRGFALRDEGRLDEARSVLQKALIAEPNDLLAMALLADVLRQQKQFGESIRLYRAVTGASPLDTEPGIGLSRALTESGDLPAAVAEMRRAVAAAPENPRFRLELSQLYAKKGNFEGARREAAAYRKLKAARAGSASAPQTP